jgi:hypothetical protein
MKKIMIGLGVMKGSKPKEAPVPEQKAPVGVGEETLKKRYRNIFAMINDIADFPEYGVKVLDAILNRGLLFEHFISGRNELTQLLTIRSDAETQKSCVKNILTLPKCWGWSLASPNNLRDTIAIFKAQEIKDTILTGALTCPGIYSKLLYDKTALATILSEYSARKPEVMKILVTDAKVFEQCGLARLKNFWAFVNENSDDKDRFLDLVLSNEDLAEKLLVTVNFTAMMKGFDNRQDEIIRYLASHPKIFEQIFSGFDFIDNFCKNKDLSQYRETLYDISLTVPGYYKRQIQPIFRLYELSQKHALEVEKMIVKEPEWVFKTVKFTTTFKRVCDENVFKDLKAAFIKHIYFFPTVFTFLMDGQPDLERMIAIIPDQAVKLRLFYQLLTDKKRLHEVIQANYENPEAMEYLKEYINHYKNDGTLTSKMMVEARETIESLLKEKSDDETLMTSLKSLKASLEPMPSAKDVKSMAKNFPKDNIPDKTSGETTRVQQPTQPGRTNSN